MINELYELLNIKKKSIIELLNHFEYYLDEFYYKNKDKFIEYAKEYNSNLDFKNDGFVSFINIDIDNHIVPNSYHSSLIVNENVIKEFNDNKHVIDDIYSYILNNKDDYINIKNKFNYISEDLLKDLLIIITGFIIIKTITENFKYNSYNLWENIKTFNIKNGDIVYYEPNELFLYKNQTIYLINTNSKKRLELKDYLYLKKYDNDNYSIEWKNNKEYNYNTNILLKLVESMYSLNIIDNEEYDYIYLEYLTNHLNEIPKINILDYPLSYNTLIMAEWVFNIFEKRRNNDKELLNNKDFTFLVSEYIKATKVLLLEKLEKNYKGKTMSTKKEIVLIGNKNWTSNVTLGNISYFIKENSKIFKNDYPFLDKKFIKDLDEWIRKIRNDYYNKDNIQNYKDSINLINETYKMITKILLCIK